MRISFRETYGLLSHGYFLEFNQQQTQIQTQISPQLHTQPHIHNYIHNLIYNQNHKQDHNQDHKEQVILLLLNAYISYNITSVYMQKSAQENLFAQFSLSKTCNMVATMTSKYEKVNAYTKGCILRKSMNLYPNQKQFIDDLQAILSYDPDSANIIFKEYPQIKYSYNEASKQDSRVKVQCKRCGQYTPPQKYCPRCQDTHYCSQVCQFNIKLTHEKEQCRVRPYPKRHHAVLVEVHFGTNLGHNLEVYFQHETSAYGLVLGKQIIKDLHEYFTGIKKTSSPDFKELTRRSKIEEKLMGFKVELKNNGKYVQFQKKQQKQYPTGVLKVDLQNLDTLKRIYEQSQILQQIQLFLLREGALMIECAQEIHNNHVHWVYIFRMPR